MSEEINKGIQGVGKELGHDKELSDEAVAGIAVAVTVVGCLLLYALYYCCTRRRRRRKREATLAENLNAWSTANTIKASSDAATKIQSFVRGKKARIAAAEKKRGKKKKAGARATAMRIDSKWKGKKKDKDKKKDRDKAKGKGGKKDKKKDRKGKKDKKQKKRGDAMARAAKKKQRAINARKKRARRRSMADATLSEEDRRKLKLERQATKKDRRRSGSERPMPRKRKDSTRSERRLSRESTKALHRMASSYGAPQMMGGGLKRTASASSMSPERVRKREARKTKSERSDKKSKRRKDSKGRWRKRRGSLASTKSSKHAQSSARLVEMMNARKKMDRERGENAAATHIQALVRGSIARKDPKSQTAQANIQTIRKNMLIKAEINAAKHAQQKHKANVKAKNDAKRQRHDAMSEALALMEAMKDNEDQDATLDSYGGIIAAYGNTK